MAHFQISELISSTPGKVFDFLYDLQNQANLLQGEIGTELLTPEAPLRRGTDVQFKMTRYGISHLVRFHIEDCVRGQRFFYRQTEGIFKTWSHVTLFEGHGPQDTLVTDIVDYKVPFGILGFLGDDIFVKRQMKAILQRRLNLTKDHFSADVAG